MSTRALDPQILLQNLGWMRRLALHLVKDESRADDVVQEVCVAALAHPPQDLGRATGWLRTVLYNAARKNRLGVVRQSVLLEKLAAHRLAAEEVSPGEQIQASQRTLEHVLELPEKYQRVLLLCFVDGLSPAEAAAELGISPSTVRTQKKRALEMLGERIRRSGTDLGAFCFAVLGLAPPRALPFGTPTPAPKPLPVDWSRAGMVAGWTATAALGVFLGGELLLSTSVFAPTIAGDLETEAAVPPEIAPAAVPPAGADSSRTSLHVSSPGARAAPETAVPSTEESVYSILAFTSGGEALLDATGLTRRLFNVVATEESAPAVLPQPVRDSYSHLGMGRSRVAGPDEPAERLFDLLVPAGRDFHATLYLGNQRLAEHFVVAGQAAIPPFEIDPLAIDGVAATVRLSLVSAVSSGPVTRAWVRAAGASAFPALQALPLTSPDSAGAWTLSPLPPGPHVIYALAEGHGAASIPVRLAPGQDLDLGLVVLRPAHKISGRLVDSRGQGIPDARVCLFHLDVYESMRRASAMPTLPTDGDGYFETDRVPSGRYAVIASKPERAILGGAPVLIDTTDGDVRDIVVTRADRYHVLTLFGDFGEMEPRAVALVAKANGVAFWAYDLEEAFRIPIEVQNGAYRVEVYDDGVKVAEREVAIEDGDAELPLTSP